MKGESEWMLILCILSTLGITITGSKLNWYEGQSQCQEFGSRLLYKKRTWNYYWTPYYKRLSMWIGMIGCYKDSAINTSISIRIRIPSVGMCQELCLEKKIMFFALKNNTCVCIQTDFIHRTHSEKPDMCNYNCNTYTDRKTFYECGGPNAYSVYFTGNTSAISTETKIPMCMALQCGDSKYLSRKCSIALQRFCQSEKLAAQGYASWRKSLDECKSSKIPSYLLGNLNLSDADSECRMFNKRNLGPTWIGVAQQIYTSYDRGRSIKKELIVKCQKCKSTECPFTDCASEEQYSCVNGSKATGKPKSVNITRPLRYNSTTGVEKRTQIYSETISFSILTESTSFTKTTVSTSTGIQTHVKVQTGSVNTETDSRFGLIILISVIIPIVVVAAVMTIIFLIRRKRHGRQKRDVQIGSSQQDDTNHYSQVDKTRNRFQHETESKNSQHPRDVEQLRSGNPHTEHEEGVYDHLGESSSRRKVEEDTYDHTGFVVGSGNCDYDTTQSIKRQEQESTYDHTETISSDTGNA